MWYLSLPGGWRAGVVGVGGGGRAWFILNLLRRGPEMIVTNRYKGIRKEGEGLKNVI